MRFKFRERVEIEMPIGNNRMKVGVSAGYFAAPMDVPMDWPEPLSRLGHFEDIFSRFHPLVYGIGLQFSGNAEDAEDISQEVFTKVWKGLEFFNFQSSFKTWIYRIALNTCIDYSRKPWRKISRYTTDLDKAMESDEGRDIPCNHETGERRLLAKEKNAQIRKAIANLKPHLKTVLVLKELDELSYDEISSVLGLSLGTISSRLNRARKSLQEYFEACTPALAHEF
jgi:RNA polymerase sigma-70 factor (ECF subfamily)